ncbi:hypothetical protein EDC01DRAFT_652237 [Geopyxis carbonaria]|nr:hypothetical protein EDC01DRAFT_652237 [Geopyxis carbonaria]
MSEDNNQLLSRISELAGQINRHKNQQERGLDGSHLHSYPAQGSYRSRGRGYSYRSHNRPRGRGSRVPITHHHKTLVINNYSPSNGPLDQLTSGSSAEIPTVNSNNSTVSNGEAWVAKRDRHMQLIKGSVYEQEAFKRAKAMAHSLEERLRRKEEKEKFKFNRFLKTSHGTESSDHEVVVGGETYRVATNGSKLIRLSGNPTDNQTPKKAVIGGVRFTRSKNGNLWRSGLIRASRSQPLRKSLNEPCKYFSLSGKCKNGLSCPYLHNPNEVAICPRFLASDSCPDGVLCDLSHDPTPHRVPACYHFLRGNCSNSNCRYAHVRVNPAALICRAFATLGYCPNGADCTERHVHECPEFDQKSMCRNAKCKLPHIERAGRRRAAVANAEKNTIVLDDQNDVKGPETSEDEDDEVIESDVDSDTLEDYSFIRTERSNQDAAMQHDFIKF